MYFSRITINPAAVDTNQLAHLVCTDGYREHQQLWRLFTEDPNAKRDFLFRREQVQGWPRFFMVSGRMPKQLNNFWTVESREYNPKLRSGQQLAFSLRVNPVIMQTGKDGKKHRHDVVMSAKKQMDYRCLPKDKRPPLIQLIEQTGIEWLDKRATKHGFSVNSGDVRIDAYIQHKTFKKNNKTAIRYSTLDYTGHITVTEPDIFQSTLYQGIGPAKAFGCGLLLVRRI